MNARRLRWVLVLGRLWLGIVGVGISRPIAWAEEDADRAADAGMVARAKEIVGRAAEFKRRLWITQMEKELEEVQRITGLSAPERKVLQETALRVVETCLQDWVQRLSAKYVRIAKRYPQIGAMMLERDLERAAIVGGESLVLGSIGPSEHPDWVEGLKRTLSSEQWKVLEPARLESRQRLTDVIYEGLRSWGERTQSRVSKPLREKVAEMTSTLALPEDRVGQLEELVKGALGRYMEAWRAKIAVPMRSMDEVSRTTVMGRVDAILFEEESALPQNQATWKEGLVRLLSVEELERMAVFERGKAEEERLEMERFLKTAEESVRVQVASGIQGKIAEIVIQLELPKERGGHLEELGKVAVQETLEAWRNGVRSVIQDWGEEQRREMLRQGNFLIPPSPESAPDKQAVWTDGLRQLLSVEEAGRLVAAEREKAERRLRIFGQILLIQLDGKVAFTTSQRKQLQPLAERLIQKQMTLLSGRLEPYSRYSVSNFFSAAAQATEGDVAAILEPVQWRHWRESCLIRPEGSGDENVSRPVKESEMTAVSEPEDVENAISDFLERKAAVHRGVAVAPLLLAAEDIIRVNGISVEIGRRLQIAASGAVEAAEKAWKFQVEQSVRSSLREPNSSNVRQQLAGLPEYLFKQSSGGSVEKSAIWENTLRTELNGVQQSVWYEALSQRSAYEVEGVSGLLLLEFDRFIGLSGSQWRRLEVMLTSVIKEYGQDISRMFPMSNGGAWYLANHSMYLPFVGLSEEELKLLFSKSQWERWSRTNEFGQSHRYWENIQRIHEQRVKK